MHAIVLLAAIDVPASEIAPYAMTDRAHIRPQGYFDKAFYELDNTRAHRDASIGAAQRSP
jgi:hypothetical protein